MDRVRGDYRHIRRVNPKLPTALFIPLYPLYFFGEQIGALLNADKAEAILKVPDYLFSCGIDNVDSTPLEIYLSLCGISVFFGVFHFVCWSSAALPAGPQLVWRISTVLVTVSPILLTVGQQMRSRFLNPGRNERSPRLVLAAQIVSGLSLWLYVAGRYALVVLALRAMSNLPDSAFHDVDWGLGFLHVS
ncbi:hypothetical protein V5O48_013315 [Marasmius crinis-equi]|uniref:Uncharacterized protein n=1 Tax=Marasmius crinis-equi TaxID=585013 RepID=A0ABR3F0E7_9AGAR